MKIKLPTFLKVILGIVLSLLLALGGLLAYFWYVKTFDPEFAFQFKSDPNPKIKSIDWVDGNKTALIIKSDKTDVNSNKNISVSQYHAASVVYKERFDGNSSIYKMDKGESVNITLYSLGEKISKEKTFDLAPILKEKGIESQVSHVQLVTHNNTEYLYIGLYGGWTKAYGKSDFKLYNLKTKEISDAPEGFMGSRLKGIWINTTITSTFSKRFGIDVDSKSLNSRYTKAKNLSTTNLYQEHPNVAKALSEGAAIYPIPNKMSDDQWFDTLLYWFGSSEDQPLEVKTTPLKVGDVIVPITSASDFNKWLENRENGNNEEVQESK